MSDNGKIFIHFYYRIDPYAYFNKKISQCLTISEEEFYQVIPSKYRYYDVLNN